MGYDDSMRGVLFREKERKSDKHPVYKGNGEVNGVQVWISAWINTAQKTGEKYLSLQFENKEGQQASGAVTPEIPIATDDFLEESPTGVPAVPGVPSAEDDIPF